MKTVTLKLASAIAIDGDVVKRGSLVEVDEALAINLLNRGKAELATDEDGVDDDDADLSKLNKAQLVELAAELGVITVGDGNTKAEIVAAIEAAKADQAE